MPLHPQAQALLDQMAAAGRPPLEEMTVAQAREMQQAFRDLHGPPEPVARATDHTIAGPASTIPVRIYTPVGEGGPFPVLVYFHGGGWVLGSADVLDVPCRALTNRAGCVLVSVDYRLAPEHPFPAAVDDATAATRWVAGNASAINGDPARIAVGGDSAGGNLAAVVARLLRDRQEHPLVYQLLVYPVTNYDFSTASYQENAAGYGLTKNGMKWFWDHYLQADADGRHPHASPLLALDLQGLPPALVITAEYDPLRDEGESYAACLREAGVAVQATRYDGMIHGFFTLGGALDQGKEAIDEAAQALRAAFAHS